MNIKEYVKKYYWLGIGLLALIIIGSTAYFLVSNKSPEKSNEQFFASSDKIYSKTANKSSKIQSSESTSNKYVEIKGAVNNPGIYPIRNNMRLAIVIQKAGGLKPEADTAQINLAKVVHDQDSFYVPQKGEVHSTPQNSAASSTSDSSKSGSGELVDLNTADAAKLQTLDGIGQKKAEKIVQYRQEKGNFKTVDDLKNISGFGDKIIQSLKDKVTVGS